MPITRERLCKWSLLYFAEYGSCCKHSEVFVDKSYPNSREDPLKKLILRLYIPPYLFCHESATMTSETWENTIFVRFNFTLCYLILTLYGENNLVPRVLALFGQRMSASYGRHVVYGDIYCICGRSSADRKARGLWVWDYEENNWLTGGNNRLTPVWLSDSKPYKSWVS